MIKGRETLGVSNEEYRYTPRWGPTLHGRDTEQGGMIRKDRTRVKQRREAQVSRWEFVEEVHQRVAQPATVSTGTPRGKEEQSKSRKRQVTWPMQWPSEPPGPCQDPQRKGARGWPCQTSAP